MAKQEKFIPGIYNYCDRWCERCTFTSRCRTYERTSNLSPEETDISNKAFWDNIGKNFADVIAMLYKMAAEKGIDLENALSKEEMKEYDSKRKDIKEFISDHELPALCKQYREIVMPFIENEFDPNLVNRNRELFEHLHMGMETEESVVCTMSGLGDCESVISWYLFFIDAKLRRALHGKLEGESFEEEKGYGKDSDGSAKIAIIAIERSMAAWVRLYELMSPAEDTALNVLAILGRLKRRAMEIFPEAMQFRRPGFDD